jgi:hypothetical protein
MLIGSGDELEKNEVGGACSTYGESRGVYRVLVGNPGGKRPLGRHRLKWDYNIKTDLQKWDVRAWSGIIWLRIGAGGGHL